jgi:hypothetical protein
MTLDFDNPEFYRQFDCSHKIGRQKSKARRDQGTNGQGCNGDT